MYSISTNGGVLSLAFSGTRALGRCCGPRFALGPRSLNLQHPSHLAPALGPFDELEAVNELQGTRERARLSAAQTEPAANDVYPSRTTQHHREECIL